jgi:hypothetical protein
MSQGTGCPGTLITEHLAVENYDSLENPSTISADKRGKYGCCWSVLSALETCSFLTSQRLLYLHAFQPARKVVTEAVGRKEMLNVHLVSRREDA